MLNYEQFVKSDDKSRLYALLKEAEKILDKYPYSKSDYISNMDRLKTSVSQSIGYVNYLMIDYSDKNEDK